MLNDLLELWNTQNKINLYLLKNLPAEGLKATTASDSWPVSQMFAHINDLRLRWVYDTGPDLTDQLPWFEQQPQRVMDAEQLQDALERSGNAVEALIKRCDQAGTKVEGFPGSLASFLGYLVSHESYHWGEIGLALSQSGRPLYPDIALGIWKGWWGD